MRTLYGLVILATATSCTRFSVEKAAACAIAPPPEAVVELTSEEALIVWDAAEHRQHFIRRAAFEADTADFGFLVPTPSVPDLVEVGNEVFERLQVVTAPEVIRETDYVPTTFCCSLVLGTQQSAPLDGSTTDMAVSAVSLVATAQVAGMDAAVLSASDPEELLTWLREHEYAARDALVDWVAPYVEAGWMITAFKIAKETEARETFGTHAVRMSFRADRPFYPYREPADAPEQPQRSLRVWFVGDARSEGVLGDEGRPWDSTEVLWSAALADAATVLADAVPAAQLPSAPHLTEMIDRASTRPNADVFFRPSEDASEIRRAPRRLPNDVELIPLPVEPALLLACGWWLWRRSRKRKSES